MCARFNIFFLHLLCRAHDLNNGEKNIKSCARDKKKFRMSLQYLRTFLMFDVHFMKICMCFLLFPQGSKTLQKLPYRNIFLLTLHLVHLGSWIYRTGSALPSSKRGGRIRGISNSYYRIRCYTDCTFYYVTVTICYTVTTDYLVAALFKM